MNKDEEEDDRLLKAWLKKDATLAGDVLENKIMSRIVQHTPPVKARKPLKIPNAVFMVCYCTLTFAALAIYFWNADLARQMQTFVWDWQLGSDTSYANYYAAILIAALLAAISFGYWKQLKSQRP